MVDDPELLAVELDEEVLEEDAAVEVVDELGAVVVAVLEDDEGVDEDVEDVVVVTTDVVRVEVVGEVDAVEDVVEVVLVELLVDVVVAVVDVDVVVVVVLLEVDVEVELVPTGNSRSLLFDESAAQTLPEESTPTPCGMFIVFWLVPATPVAKVLCPRTTEALAPLEKEVNSITLSLMLSATQRSPEWSIAMASGMSRPAWLKLGLRELKFGCPRTSVAASPFAKGGENPRTLLFPPSAT